MTEQILLKLQSGKSIHVSKKLLIENSNVFRRIFLDLGFEEHEIYDFPDDAVTHFIKLLGKPDTAEFSNTEFREVHKIAVVFEVGWLKDRCRQWLTEKISGDTVLETEEKLYVFHECFFIFRRWGDSSLMDIFVSRLALIDNSGLIVLYTSDGFEKLDDLDLQLMLKLGGSDTSLFMDIILRSVNDMESLHQNTMFLLERLNLPLCLVQNEALFDSMFTSILELRDISLADSRTLSTLLLEVSKKAHKRNSPSICSGATAVFDDRTWQSLVKCCEKFTSLIEAITERNVTSLFIVVDMLLVRFLVNPPSSEETEREFITLINTCCDRNLQKISYQYIDLITSALNISPLSQKYQLISLLERIKSDEKLCSNHYVLLTSEETSTKITSRKDRTYVLQHPGTVCSREGRCGFKLKHCLQKEGGWRIQLCTEEADYRDTDIHYHEVVSSDNMYHYVLVSGTSDTGQKVSVPARFGWWTKWLPSLQNLTVESDCIQYNLTGYLVDKRD